MRLFTFTKQETEDMKTKTLGAIAAPAVIIAAIAAAVALSPPAAAQGQGFQGGPGGGDSMMRQGGPQMANRGHRGRTAGCDQGRAAVDKKLTAGDIKTLAQARLIMMGNKNLKVGKVTEKDDKTVIVSITTKDGSLVEEMEVSRATGRPNKRR